MLSGSGLLLSARGDIVNRGSIISAAGSILLASERDIVNDARFGSYEYNSYDYEYRPWWAFGACIKCVHTHEFTGVVQGGDIATLVGDITLSAKRDIRNVGSHLTSGGAIALSADQDILLDAQTVEVNNQNKTTGFSGWFSYGSEQTRWNNFTTQLSQLEGGSITAAAKRNLTGIEPVHMAMH